MIAFQVYLNGKRLCVAGIGKKGVLSSIMHYLPKIERVYISVGGLYSKTEEHVEWIRQQKLIAGDEIRIKIVNTKVADKPAKRFRIEERMKELGLALKNKPPKK